MIIIMIGRSTSPGVHGYIHFGALYQRQNLCASHRQTAVAVGSSFEAHRLVLGYFGHHESARALRPEHIWQAHKMNPYAHISSGPKHGRRAPRSLPSRVAASFVVSQLLFSYENSWE